MHKGKTQTKLVFASLKKKKMDGICYMFIYMDSYTHRSIEK